MLYVVSSCLVLLTALLSFFP